MPEREGADHSHPADDDLARQARSDALLRRPPPCTIHRRRDGPCCVRQVL